MLILFGTGLALRRGLGQTEAIIISVSLFLLAAWFMENASENPAAKLFKYTLSHLFVALASAAWVSFAGFMLYELLFVAAFTEYSWYLLLISIWALLYNIPTMISAAFLCSKRMRERVMAIIDAESKKALEAEEKDSR